MGGVSLIDCLAWLRNIVDIWEYENIGYMMVTQDLVNGSVLGLHLGRVMVSLVRMVS